MDPERIQSLTEAAALGDRTALEDLLAHYLPDLQAFVRLRTDPQLRQRLSSADLVQSVCKEALQKASRFQYPDEAAFRRWLFTTALRKIHDRRDFHLAEKRNAQREAALKDGQDRAVLDCYANFTSPSQAAVAREELERIESVIDDMTDDYRRVIILSKVVGLNRSQIAKEMGRSEGAIRMLLHRALAELVARLS